RHDAQLGVRSQPDIEVAAIVEVKCFAHGVAAEHHDAERDPARPRPPHGRAIENYSVNVKTFQESACRRSASTKLTLRCASSSVERSGTSSPRKPCTRMPCSALMSSPASSRGLIDSRKNPFCRPL